MSEPRCSYCNRTLIDVAYDYDAVICDDGEELFTVEFGFAEDEGLCVECYRSFQNGQDHS